MIFNFYPSNLVQMVKFSSNTTVRDSKIFFNHIPAYQVDSSEILSAYIKFKINIWQAH